MLRVIVEVRITGQAGRDLEVPAELPVAKLASMIAMALGLYNESEALSYSYRLEVPLLDRVLLENESLVQAGVWDGAIVMLHRVSSAALVSESGRKYLLLRTLVPVGRKSALKNGEEVAQWLVDLGDEPMGDTVHREHVVLATRGTMWTLRRVPGTANVTLINGRVVDTDRVYPLVEGDQIQLGGVKLRFTMK